MYEIDFVKMKQKNLDPTYGTEREISRRPALSRFEFKFFIDVLETMFKTNFRFKILVDWKQFDCVIFCSEKFSIA